MRTLIYTTVKDQFVGNDYAKTLRSAKDTSSVRVTEFWQGEIERCDLVVTDNAAVSSAYKAAGIKTEPFSKPVAVVKEVEEITAPQEPTEDTPKLEVRPRGRPAKVKVEE